MADRSGFDSGFDPAVLADMAKLVDDRPAPARNGRLGGCVACGQPGASHFDTTGHFIGCSGVNDGTVFALVPLQAKPPVDRDGSGIGTRPVGAPRLRRRGKAVAREFTRARYRLTDEGRRTQAADIPGENRKAVRSAFSRAPHGLIAREVRERTGLAHGAVQEALGWLREHGLAIATEDTPSSPDTGSSTK